MTATTYTIALGSNRRGRAGGPGDMIRAALAEIGGVIDASPIISSTPVGPSERTYANAAAVIESDELPQNFLARLKAIERKFGRRQGRRWGARVIDLDIIFWSGGTLKTPKLTIPHPRFRERAFVLVPVVAIVPHLRDPMTGRTVRQLAAAVDRKRPRH